MRIQHGVSQYLYPRPPVISHLAQLQTAGNKKGKIDIVWGYWGYHGGIRKST